VVARNRDNNEDRGGKERHRVLRYPSADSLFGPLKRLRLPADARVFQIIALSSLLVFGWSLRAFDIAPLGVIAILSAALGAQALGAFMFKLKFEIKSALITTLSLTLLLRSDDLWPLALAAFIAIFSKFILRIGGKHLFNPANAGIVALLLLSTSIAPGAAWTTPGQWGAAVWLAALIAGGGMFVAYRAARLDVPLIFLGVFAALTIGRALWLGDPLAIPLLRLQNGALILYAFFMISDPKTTPDGAIGRAIFASGAALIAFTFTYLWFNTDGTFYALAIMCVLRPLIERFDPAPAFRWGDPVRAPPLPFLKRRPQINPAE
jgi:Na+-transporting NADH:ubiquinone oxidoreductase subunit NqrB